MRQQRITKNISLNIKADQYTQCAAKTHGRSFHSRTNSDPSLCSGINGIVLPVYLLDSFRRNRVIVKTWYYCSDCIAQGFGFSLGNRPLCPLID